MNKLKAGVCLALALILCLALAGCMNNGNQPAATPTPAVTTTPMTTTVPEMTTVPDVTSGTGNNMTGNQNAQNGGGQQQAGATPFDWTQSAADVEARINKISEIAASRVVVSGNTALVGVQFTSEYKGEMTERIRSLIAGEVMAADAAVQKVAATAQAEDVTKINEIADKIKNGTPVDQLQQEIDSIVRNVTTIS